MIKCQFLRQHSITTSLSHLGPHSLKLKVRSLGVEVYTFLDWRLNSENDSRVHGQPSWLTMDRVLARITHEFPVNRHVLEGDKGVMIRPLHLGSTWVDLRLVTSLRLVLDWDSELTRNLSTHRSFFFFLESPLTVMRFQEVDER